MPRSDRSFDMKGSSKVTGKRSSTSTNRSDGGRGKRAAPLPDVLPMDPDMPYAFLVCSFSEESELLSARNAGINPALARFGLPVYRIDEIPSASPVIDATRAAIEQADVVIADLSGARPNCYYEVGYAHAVGRPVVHLIREPEQPQFNVAGLRFLRYRDPRHLQDILADHMLRHVLTTHGPADPEDDPNLGAFGRRAFVDPYLISGRVHVLHDDDDELWSYVNAMVRSVDPRRPLTGDMTFHLHPDFRPKKIRVRAKHGVALLEEVYTYGSWTLGATLHCGIAFVPVASIATGAT